MWTSPCKTERCWTEGEPQLMCRHMWSELILPLQVFFVYRNQAVCQSPFLLLGLPALAPNLMLLLGQAWALRSHFAAWNTALCIIVRHRNEAYWGSIRQSSLCVPMTGGSGWMKACQLHAGPVLWQEAQCHLGDQSCFVWPSEQPEKLPQCYLWAKSRFLCKNGIERKAKRKKKAYIPKRFKILAV